MSCDFHYPILNSRQRFTFSIRLGHRMNTEAQYMLLQVKSLAEIQKPLRDILFYSDCEIPLYRHRDGDDIWEKGKNKTWESLTLQFCKVFSMFMIGFFGRVFCKGSLPKRQVILHIEIPLKGTQCLIWHYPWGDFPLDHRSSDIRQVDILWSRCHSDLVQHI